MKKGMVVYPKFSLYVDIQIIFKIWLDYTIQVLKKKTNKKPLFRFSVVSKPSEFPEVRVLVIPMR